MERHKVDHDAFERSACRPIAEFAPPPRNRIAYVVPTTSTTMGAALERAKRSNAIVVGGAERPSLMAPAALLASLTEPTPEVAPEIFVFSDQILAPADTPILIKHNGEGHYFSPLEAILHVKYGYRLLIWTTDGYLPCPDSTDDLRDVFQLMLRYLASCDRLGNRWSMRNAQALRRKSTRLYNAKRKLRFFKSAVINAYVNDPCSPRANELLQQITATEKLLQAH